MGLESGVPRHMDLLGQKALWMLCKARTRLGAYLSRVQETRLVMGRSMKPRLRKDGACLQCEKPRKLAKRSVHQTVAFAHYERDPFCSKVCCEAWYAERGEKVPWDPQTAAIPF